MNLDIYLVAIPLESATVPFKVIVEPALQTCSSVHVAGSTPLTFVKVNKGIKSFSTYLSPYQKI
jgi:hypothetical protein